MTIRKLLADKRTKLDNAETDNVDRSSPSSVKDKEYYRINIDDIKPNPEQPRKFFDPETLQELAESIRQKGVLQPILVKPDDEHNLLLVAGERRWRAAKIAGLDQIPCIITTGNSDEISLIENVQRDNLKPLEEAEALQRMVNKYNYTQEHLATIIGKAKSTVSEILSLNQLPELIKSECRHSSHYSRRLLVEIVRQPSHRKMIHLFIKAQEDLNSEKLRKIARARNQSEKPKVETIISGAKKLYRDLELLNIGALGQEQEAQLTLSLGNLKGRITEILGQ
jgi:ParB family chromosome partitioning protein